MNRVEIGDEGYGWFCVYVDGKRVSAFDNVADAEAWAEAKRAEIAKAQPYYVTANGPYIWHRESNDYVAFIDQNQMPNGTPQVWQRKLLALCADLLNGGDLNDPRFKGVE